MLLWSWRNITFSYERILNPRQSFSVELGYLVMPKVSDTVAGLLEITSGKKNGFNLTLEYRFYLTKLNARSIPAGLYIGPYFTNYYYNFHNDFNMLHVPQDSAGTINGNYWSFNLGLELGYQFVFWKRWTLDLVMIGPSVSYYGGKTEIKGNFDADQIREINEDLYDQLLERFPALGQVTGDKTFQQTGKLDVVRWGFRYLVQIGFRF